MPIYGDFGYTIITGRVSRIVSAEYDRNNELMVTIVVSRKCYTNRAFMLFILRERHIPWLRKIRVGDHVLAFSYLNIISHTSEEFKGAMSFSPNEMFVIDDNAPEREDSIIVPKKELDKKQ